MKRIAPYLVVSLAVSLAVACGPTRGGGDDDDDAATPDGLFFTYPDHYPDYDFEAYFMLLPREESPQDCSYLDDLAGGEIPEWGDWWDELYLEAVIYKGANVDWSETFLNWAPGGCGASYADGFYDDANMHCLAAGETVSGEFSYLYSLDVDSYSESGVTGTFAWGTPDGDGPGSSEAFSVHHCGNVNDLVSPYGGADGARSYSERDSSSSSGESSEEAGPKRMGSGAWSLRFR